jgi:hypothetical protein
VLRSGWKHLAFLRSALTILAGCWILGVPGSGHAAKWPRCPSPPLPLYRSALGSVTAPFVHGGHEIGIVLSEQDVEATGGGFSTEPDGNIINVIFASLFGDRVVLPALTATAVSPTTLYFDFPDARAAVGQPLAGPVEIFVTSERRRTARILARHLVALPPANDVAAMVGGAPQVNALATLDTRGDIWIPVQFSGFGSMEKPMPQCPGQFIPVTAFSVTLDLPRPQLTRGGESSIRYMPLRTIHRINLYLGDFIIDGINYYGLDAANYLRVIRIPHQWAVAICGVNDAADLVLRARGRATWTRHYSVFADRMPSSRPLDIMITNVAADPSANARLRTLRVDGFGSECLLP